MSVEKQTVNVLILELATMVVAISLAFTSTIITTLDLRTVVSFIFTNTLVIWFWWSYVVDRLSFPPKTTRFPIPDIMVLILISLIPFALRQERIYYLSVDIGALVIIWAFMIHLIIGENPEVDEKIKNELRTEVNQRILVGLLFVLAAVLSLISEIFGLELFVVLAIVIIVWNLFTRRGRKELSPDAGER